MGIYFLNSYLAHFLYDTIQLKARQVMGEYIPFSDVVLIMVNDTVRSGRASRINALAVSTRPIDDIVGTWHEYLINHELAHALGGLDDAYSESAGENFNKTSNSNPSTIRWKDYLSHPEVGIESIATDVFIPSLDCMMISTDPTYTCPVCSDRISETVSNVRTRLVAPHRLFQISSDDSARTQTFEWDPIPGGKSL